MCLNECEEDGGKSYVTDRDETVLPQCAKQVLSNLGEQLSKVVIRISVIFK